MTDYHHSLLKLEQYQDLKSDYIKYLDNLKSISKHNQIDKIKLDNRSSQMKIKEFNINRHQDKKKIYI